VRPEGGDVDDDGSRGGGGRGSGGGRSLLPLLPGHRRHTTTCVPKPAAREAVLRSDERWGSGSSWPWRMGSGAAPAKSIDGG